MVHEPTVVTKLQSNRRGSPSVQTILLAALCLTASSCQKPVAEESLTVFAAASLQRVFEDLGAQFRSAHPSAQLTFQFAGTQTLATQIEHGARADVFAAADEKHLLRLSRMGRIASSAPFAGNEVVLVVDADSAPLLTTFEDLPGADRIVVGTPEVPIGEYTQQILAAASKTLGSQFSNLVNAKVVSKELSVAQVLNKIALGEAQAGFVYRSDVVHLANRIRVIAIPRMYQVPVTYLMGTIRGTKHPALADDWVALVHSPVGRERLQAAGLLLLQASGTKQ
jgi:molybdate transport system substrate-binding protein